jgi:hypothetical protein
MLHKMLDLVGCCENSNKRSDSIKDREFLDLLYDYQFLKKDSTPFSKGVNE